MYLWECILSAAGISAEIQGCGVFFVNDVRATATPTNSPGVVIMLSSYVSITGGFLRGQ